MKLKRLLIPLMLVVASAFTFAACTSPKYNENEIKEFIENYDRSTPFTDNQVLITLTEDATFKTIFKDYTVKDFSGIGAIEVDELDGRTTISSGLTHKIRQYLLEDSSGNTIPSHLKHYNRMFCITLDKNDEDNVLRSVYILRQRADIKLAEPNNLDSPYV